MLFARHFHAPTAYSVALEEGKYLTIWKTMLICDINNTLNMLDFSVLQNSRHTHMRALLLSH